MRFATVWLGQTISHLGSSLTGFALGVWVYQVNDSVTEFALILLSNTLPVILAAPWAGSLSDRFDRRKVMLLSDLAAGVCTLALLSLFALGNLALWHIYLINACNALARACQWPAYAASIPQLVPREQLTRANGLLQLSYGISQLVAPLAGGALLGVLPMSNIFFVDLGTFVIAVVTLGLVRFPRALVESEERTPLRSGLSAGWHALRSRRGLLALTLLVVFSNFTAGSIEVLVTPLVLSFASPVKLGILMAIGGLGMVGGSLALGLWGGSRRLVGVILISEGVGACSMILAGVSPTFVVLAVAAFVYFATLPIGTGSHHSLIQHAVEPALHGRLFALLNASASLALILGFLSAGPLADYVFEPLMMPDGGLAATLGFIFGTGPGRGIGLLFVLMGALVLLTVVSMALLPSVRRMSSEKMAVPDVDTAL